MSGGSSAVFTIAGLLSNMSLRHLSPSLRTAVNNADTCTHSTYQCYGALSLTLRKPTQPAAPSVVACHLMPHVTVLPTFYTYVCTSLQDSLRAYVGTCWRPSHSPQLLGKEINADGCQSLLQAAADIATSTAHEPNSIIAAELPHEVAGASLGQPPHSEASPCCSHCFSCKRRPKGSRGPYL